MINENENNLQINTKYEEIKTLLKIFLNKLTVEFDNIEIIEEDIHPIVLITTNDSGILIGNNGESLRALNYIIKRIIEKKCGIDSKDKLQFLLDINGYNSKRILTLKNQANILAHRAKTFKSDVEMDPINAYERMIVHSIFKDDPEINTESKGNGQNRKIVFKYINNKSTTTDKL